MLKLLDLAGKSAKSNSFNTLFSGELLKLLDLAVSESCQLPEASQEIISSTNINKHSIKDHDDRTFLF